MSHHPHTSILRFHLHREITELYLSIALMYFAMSMVSIFVPVYLFELGYSFMEIIAFFALDYFAMGIFFPFGLKIASRIGLKHSMMLSFPFMILNYAFLYFLPTHAWLFFLAPLGHSIRNALFWPAFHVDFAKFSGRKDLGKSMSLFHIIITLMSVLGPAVTSFLYLFFDQAFSNIFLIAIVLLSLAIVPLALSKDSFDFDYFSIKKSFSYFSSSASRGKIAFIAEAFSAKTMIIFWPLFIYHAGLSLSDFGYLTSFTTFVAVIVMIFIGRQTDKLDKHYMLGKGSRLYSLAWLFRAFATGTYGLIASDIFGRISAKAAMIPLHALVYEKAKKMDIIYYIQSREYALFVGRVLYFSLVALLFVSLVPIYGISGFFIALFFMVSLTSLCIGLL